MASEIGVQTIQHTNGTDAITIDSNGVVKRSVVPAWRLSVTQTDYTSTGFKDLPIDTSTDALTENNARFLNGGVTVSGNVITVPVSGFYQLNYTARVDVVGSGYLQIELRVNDVSSRSLSSVVDDPSATFETLHISEVQYLEANDELHYYVYVSSDTSYHIENNSMISGFLVG